MTNLRRTAAEVLAAAVYETFPEVELWGGDATLSGFYYDFFFPHPIHPELHLQIEEKMRQIAREKRAIKDLEMHAVSAKEFLKKHGQAARAEQVEGGGLFSLVQIGAFVDLSSGEHCENTSCLQHFKLFPPILLEGRGLRIMGAVQETKEELKEFLKKWAAYPRKRHEKVGEGKHFWKMYEEGLVWLPEGLRARKKLVDCLWEHVFPGVEEVRCPAGSHLRQKILSDLEFEAVAEMVPLKGESSPIEDAGLLSSTDGEAMEITTSLKKITSLLQSIAKTLTILGFSYTVCLVGSRRNPVLVEALEKFGKPFEKVPGEGNRIEFLAADGLGRVWCVASVTAKEFVFVQVFIERNLALLLESVIGSAFLI